MGKFKRHLKITERFYDQFLFIAGGQAKVQGAIITVGA